MVLRYVHTVPEVAEGSMRFLLNPWHGHLTQSGATTHVLLFPEEKFSAFTLPRRMP